MGLQIVNNKSLIISAYSKYVIYLELNLIVCIFY